eukprot:CAMPEP_0169318950 /NCGR_PEP_ID=MMETSP1017-20121227/7566_1 /TAXON_ID=342587 /ORGANISM="Karlodinium micrum, Strain CCMP2283" /LENGTH=161 /DNA_ID=CAMNT_0009413273 /DNA_START=52 /DNA_END=534 /DNA_ORIENTATION=+
MTKLPMMLCLLVSPLLASSGGSDRDTKQKAGAHIHEHDLVFRNQMRNMMAEEDDTDDAISEVLTSDGQDRGGFLQVKKHGKVGPSMDDYMKDSADGLSLALGPRWDGRALNDKAETSTRALLQSISGGHALSSLKHMMLQYADLLSACSDSPRKISIKRST